MEKQEGGTKCNFQEAINQPKGHTTMYHRMIRHCTISGGTLHTGQGWAGFFCNGLNNIFDLVNDLVSVTTTQLCHYSQGGKIKYKRAYIFIC